MPLLKPSEMPAGLVPSPSPGEAERESFLALLGPGYETENVLGALPAYLEASFPTTDDVPYRWDRTDTGWSLTPTEKIETHMDFWQPRWMEGTVFELYPEELVGVESLQDYHGRKKRLEREHENRQRLHSAGLKGMGASMLMGMLSPDVVLPIGFQLKTGVGLLRGASRTAYAGSVGATAGEVALQEQELLRTKEESLLNITAAAFLGGVLGGSAGLLPMGVSRRLRAQMAQLMDGEGWNPKDFVPDGRVRIRVDENGQPAEATARLTVAEHLVDIEREYHANVIRGLRDGHFVASDLAEAQLRLEHAEASAERAGVDLEGDQLSLFLQQEIDRISAMQRRLEAIRDPQSLPALRSAEKRIRGNLGRLAQAATAARERAAEVAGELGEAARRGREEGRAAAATKEQAAAVEELDHNLRAQEERARTETQQLDTQIESLEARARTQREAIENAELEEAKAKLKDEDAVLAAEERTQQARDQADVAEAEHERALQRRDLVESVERATTQKRRVLTRGREAAEPEALRITAEDLKALRIRKDQRAAIVTALNRNASDEELLKLPGIGKKLLAKVRELYPRLRAPAPAPRRLRPARVTKVRDSEELQELLAGGGQTGLRVTVLTHPDEVRLPTKRGQKKPGPPKYSGPGTIVGTRTASQSAQVRLDRGGVVHASFDTLGVHFDESGQPIRQTWAREPVPRPGAEPPPSRLEGESPATYRERLKNWRAAIVAQVRAREGPGATRQAVTEAARAEEALLRRRALEAEQRREGRAVAGRETTEAVLGPTPAARTSQRARNLGALADELDNRAQTMEHGLERARKQFPEEEPSGLTVSIQRAIRDTRTKARMVRWEADPAKAATVRAGVGIQDEPVSEAVSRFADELTGMPSERLTVQAEADQALGIVTLPDGRRVLASEADDWVLAEGTIEAAETRLDYLEGRLSREEILEEQMHLPEGERDLEAEARAAEEGEYEEDLFGLGAPARIGGGAGDVIRPTPPNDPRARSAKLANIMGMDARSWRWLLRFNPKVRMATSPFDDINKVLQFLSDTGLWWERNFAGVANPHSVESNIMLENAVQIRVLEDIREAYVNLVRRLEGKEPVSRPGIVQSRLTIAQNRLARARGQTEIPTPTEFYERISKAQRRNDIDADYPEVTEMARMLRRDVWNPARDEFVGLGALPEGVTPRGAASYLTRLTDHYQLKNRENDWIELISQGYVRRDGVPEELARDMARQDRERILQAPDGRILWESYAHTQAVDGQGRIHRGTKVTKKRTLPVDDIELEEAGFLVNNIDWILKFHFRSTVPDLKLMALDRQLTSPDVQLREGWRPDPALRSVINRIEANMDLAISRAARDTKLQRELLKRRTSDLRDLRSMVDLLRGTYGAPKDPDSALIRAAIATRRFNYLIDGGTFMLSSLPDVARVFMVNGLIRTFRTGILPLIRDWDTVKLNTAEGKLAGTCGDVALNQRQIDLFDLGDGMGRGSRGERLLKRATDEFSIINFLVQWTTVMKQISTMVSGQRIHDDVILTARGITSEFSDGNVSAARNRLAKAGIGDQGADRIAAELERQPITRSGLRALNTSEWTDAEAREIFRMNLRSEVDSTINTPKVGDRPLFMSRELGRFMLQYKSFAFASTMQTLLPMLQHPERAWLNGAMISLGLGMMSLKLKAIAGGWHTPKVFDDEGNVNEKNLYWWVRTGGDRSGIFGFVPDLNNAIGIATRGRLSFGRAVGGGIDPDFRYTNRDIFSEVGGPSVQTARDLSTIAEGLEDAFLRGIQPRRAAYNAWKRTVPGQNLFYANRLVFQPIFDAIPGVGKAAGLERRVPVRQAR